MKLRKFYILNADIYKVSLYTQEWSEADQALIEQFGEPEIDLGGSFTGPPAFTLPSNLVRIMSESPFTQSFDFNDYADAEDRAGIWNTEIIVRIKSAVTTFRANTDDFSGEAVETI